MKPLAQTNLAAPAGTLMAPCWCGRYFVWVPKEDVRAGVSASCERNPECHR